MASPWGPRPRGHERAVGTSERAYRSLLRAYPRELRDEHGDEMARCFQDLCREELEDGSGLGLAALWARTLPELLYTALKERSTMLARNAYRAAVGVALAAAFILVWMNLAVGVIGTEDDLANLMYVGVLAVGIIGAIVARFRPHGMARALFATALAQALVAGIALIFGLGLPWSPPLEILALNGFFVALFVGSAMLFRHAGREQTPAGAGPEG
jgi:GNAT superfamily N-acetyltransferase